MRLGMRTSQAVHFSTERGPICALVDLGRPELDTCRMQRVLMPALIGLAWTTGCGLDDTSPLGSGTLAQVQTCDTRNGEQTPHWEPAQRCIGISYEPSLSPYLDDLQAGLDAWSRLSCSRLCFEAPEAIERGDTIDGVGWIHFQPTTSPQPQVRQTELRYREDSGKVLIGIVSVSPGQLERLPPDIQRGVWVAAVAEALGLPSSDGGTSARARDLDDLSEVPTSEDAEAFCGFYGEGGICALLP